jgi:hypothetical protein
MSSILLLLAAMASAPQGVIAVGPVPASGPDTSVAATGDAGIPSIAPTDSARARLLPDSPADTVRRRPRAVEVSDAYEMRLRIHRYAAYTMIPLFVTQSVAGNQLYVADQSGSPRPGWAQTTHSLGAAGLGTLFTVNTVTGLWNLWDSRDNEAGRTKRWIHSALLLGSDAGFTWAGIKLASDAKNSSSARDQHRRVSYISMGVALAGYAVMLVGDH